MEQNGNYHELNVQNETKEETAKHVVINSHHESDKSYVLNGIKGESSYEPDRIDVDTGGRCGRGSPPP